MLWAEWAKSKAQAEWWEEEVPVWQLARLILQRVLSDPLPEDLDVEDATGKTVVIDLDDDEFENRIDDD